MRNKMKKISALIVAAACMFVMSASAFAADAPKKVEKKKHAKKEAPKTEEVKPADAAAPEAPAPVPAPEAAPAK